MEDFVTYDQALRLRELGFDWDCGYYYNECNQKFMPNTNDSYGQLNTNDLLDNINRIWNCISAPTLSQAQKWLREVKRIHIVIDAVHRMNCDGTYAIFYPYTIKDWEGKILNNFGLGYECYESSLEEAIDEALELLK